MEKRKKVGGRDFVKGDPRCGRKPIPEEVKALRKLNKEEFCTLATKYLWASKEEIESIISQEGKGLSSMEFCFVKTIQNAYRKGNLDYLEKMLEYILGKPRQVTELVGKDGGPIESVTETINLKNIDESILRKLAESESENEK